MTSTISTNMFTMCCLIFSMKAFARQLKLAEIMPLMSASIGPYARPWTVETLCVQHGICKRN